MAVVKANAYGHGIVETARAALAGGAEWCAVARIEEALALRQAGVQAPILVTGFIAEQRLPEAIDSKISLTVYASEQAKIFSKAAQSLHERLKVHAKIDTSMGRLGVFPEEGLQFIRRMYQLPGLEVEGVFTHFASADEPKNPATDRAIDRFQGLIDELEASGLRPPLVHAANSATALYYLRARFDLVRCGISIYGLHPSSEAPLPSGFQAALAWKARSDFNKDAAAWAWGRLQCQVCDHPQRVDWNHFGRLCRWIPPAVGQFRPGGRATCSRSGGSVYGPVDACS